MYFCSSILYTNKQLDALRIPCSDIRGARHGGIAHIQILESWVFVLTDRLNLRFHERMDSIYFAGSGPKQIAEIFICTHKKQIRLEILFFWTMLMFNVHIRKIFCNIYYACGNERVLLFFYSIVPFDFPSTSNITKMIPKMNNPKSNGFRIERVKWKKSKNANANMYTDRNLLYCNRYPFANSDWQFLFESFFALVRFLPAQCCAWKKKSTLLK